MSEAMAPPAAPDAEALIIGAGPVGLTMAYELTRHGLSCRIVDLNEHPSIWSKAQILHARTLEVLEDMEIVQRFLARGRIIHALNVYTPTLQRVAHIQIGGLDSQYNFMLSLSQRETELLLADCLAERGIRVERQVKLTGFVQDDTGVTATLLHPSGQEEVVRTAWLCGCDGAHSRVRQTLGIPFKGSTYEEELIQADLHITWPFHHGDDEIIGFVSEHGLIGAFPLPGDGRYRIIAFDSNLQPTLETFQMLLDTRGPRGAVASDPAWMIDFRIHRRLAPSFRSGRVFLAGDAAHIHSPAGGQGMNMGIQDAYNLGWKLALVHRGLGQQLLLDSYEQERHPVAAATVQLTDRLTRGAEVALALRSPLLQQARNQLLGLLTSLGGVQRRAVRALSMLGTAYPDSPIVEQHQSSVWHAAFTADSSETPGLRDWLDFGSGPAPGERAHDALLPGSADSENEPRRLFALLRGTHHTLLLFDGALATAEGYQRLEHIGQQVRTQYGKLIMPYLIVPYAQKPAAVTWDGPLILDSEGELHRHYGARAECLYLIRPDGYVGYRSQPVDTDKFMSYLSRIFCAHTKDSDLHDTDKDKG